MTFGQDHDGAAARTRTLRKQNENRAWWKPIRLALAAQSTRTSQRGLKGVLSPLPCGFVPVVLALCYNYLGRGTIDCNGGHITRAASGETSGSGHDHLGQARGGL